MTKDYQQYINEIEECKNKFSEGMTSKCKKLIDECYSEGIEKKVTELELYDRKAVLLNDKNYICKNCEKMCSAYIEVSNFDSDFILKHIEYMKKQNISRLLQPIFPMFH